MDPREFNHADLSRRAPAATAATEPGEDYRVELRFTVRDARSLWAAAAAKALSVGMLTIDDVEDTLGPSEDPSVADCLAMLAEPAALPGCKLEDFSVSRILPGIGVGRAIAA